MAVTSQIIREIEHANREAGKLREGSTYREAREKFDRAAANWRSDVVADYNSKTIHDEIKDIESGLADRRERRCYGTVVVRHIFKCRACKEPLGRGCPDRHYEYTSPLTGKTKVEDPFDCPHCGNNPWFSAPGDVAPQALLFKPYYDVSLSKDAYCPAGVEYVPGKGHLIRSQSALREFARANGKDYR